MEVFCPCGAGLDVHKKTVVASCICTGPDRPPLRATATFGTTTAELLRLSDWLTAARVTHIALESTGVYWKPIFNLLESSFTVWLLNAYHVKNVPGRKTDVQDAQWLADLLRYGLVRPSFIPPAPQRELRDLTRERTNFVRQRATLVNRVQRVLEDANIKLGDVASNVLGVSGRAMLDALIAGEADGAKLAGLAAGKLRRKQAELEQALTGRVQEQHRFLLRQLLAQVDSLDTTITAFKERIAVACQPQAELVALLDTIPGVGREVAEAILAELGADMSRLPTAAHAAAWAGVAPGNKRSAGRQRSGQVRQGNRHLQTVLVQAARGAAHTKDTYLSAQYRRLAKRRGDKRAILAVAHTILVIAYHLLKRREPYTELGGDYFERQAPEARARRLTRQLARLGYKVELTAGPSAEAGA